MRLTLARTSEEVQEGREAVCDIETENEQLQEAVEGLQEQVSTTSPSHPNSTSASRRAGEHTLTLTLTLHSIPNPNPHPNRLHSLH